MSTNVLVFGATGAVGSATAIEAHNRGAHVHLALRDTSKPLHKLSASDEKAGNYTRIAADLSDASSVTAAVKQSSATAAFVYTMHMAPDAMASTFAALKDAGVTYVVLLSSFSVAEPASATDMSSFIPGVHARAEMALQDSGLDAAMLRPAYFASNLFAYAQGVKKGRVEVFVPKAVFDYVVPGDIGRVAGGLLVERKARGGLYLHGPQLRPVREAVGVLGRVVGREVEVEEIGEEAFKKSMGHLPGVVVDSLTVSLKAMQDKPVEVFWSGHEEAVENIRRFGGAKPTTLEEWAEEVKGAFGGTSEG
ncbi:NAD(P)-binding protein [Polyplosphaeria fusca]|uniref:NAD(P)-binding protein n=1 Tax=Polyplosphaeria fusca TaxID=682080 RepID=A0A9P4QZI5_9PLEO|nr:NAD(P)-binding protein [Polyplosphaeria fusca]